MSTGRLLGAAAMPAAALMLAGCSLLLIPEPDQASGDPAPGPHGWLESVCPVSATYASEFDADFGFDDLPITDQERCSWNDADGEEQTISVYVLSEEPDLTSVADAYQSGDGISPDYLRRPFDGGWAVVFTYDSGRSLHPLLAQGFSR